MVKIPEKIRGALEKLVNKMKENENFSGVGEKEPQVATWTC